MESNSSARLTDKNTLHAKVRISHVLVNKPLVTFCKTRTGLNLCNKQFNCTSKFSLDLCLLGPDHTFTLLHSARRGWVCCQAQQIQNGLRGHPCPGKQQKQCEQFPLKIIHALITHEWFSRGDIFQQVAANLLMCQSRKTCTSNFSCRVCSVGE